MKSAVVRKGFIVIERVDGVQLLLPLTEVITWMKNGELEERVERWIDKRI